MNVSYRMVLQITYILLQCLSFFPAYKINFVPCTYVVVNFLSQVIFVFLLFLGMVMYANEIETKEK